MGGNAEGFRPTLSKFDKAYKSQHRACKEMPVNLSNLKFLC